MPNTPEHDAWIEKVFGVRPSDYGAPQTQVAAKVNDAAASKDGKGVTPAPAELALFANEWKEARLTASNAIARLQNEIARDLDGTPDAEKIEQEFVAYAQQLDQRLGTTLLALLVAASKSGAEKDIARIGKIVDEHLAFVRDDEMVEVLETNPLVQIDLRHTLEAPLIAMKAALGNQD